MKLRLTELICPNCGEIVTIQRTSNRLKKEGHIKDLYCPSCKKTRKFIEIVDRDKCYYNLLYKNNLTQLEQLVFSYLNKNKTKVKTLDK